MVALSTGGQQIRDYSKASLMYYQKRSPTGNLEVVSLYLFAKITASYVITLWNGAVIFEKGKKLAS